MSLAYPVTLKRYASGQVGVRFVDVPEAITAGVSRAEALALAEDALLVALSGYVDAGRPLPRASKPTRGQPLITLPARVAFKFAIHLAMRQAGMTQTLLAARLGVDARQVRRILDIDHESTLDQLECALAALGLRASLVVTKIAA
ncbi:MAG: hypothetical protein IPG63_14670 [Xanthomonadales bacterium]|nr:hypothetical protein [Xanthomonadales bacterium]MBK7145900.1 hypothetical protein [Xanthomonadales bacterium]MCC6562799.1 hypothetical protein [Xanthomonadales bacterium]